MTRHLDSRALFDHVITVAQEDGLLA